MNIQNNTEKEYIERTIFLKKQAISIYREEIDRKKMEIEDLRLWIAHTWDSIEMLEEKLHAVSPREWVPRAVEVKK